MNRINIDNLTEAELIDLNHRIVERLRLMHQVRAHAEMLEFSIGDRVEFDGPGPPGSPGSPGSPGRPIVTGMLTRYNKKSVTVITEDGQRWNVAPRLLRKIKSAGGGGTGNNSGDVIPFPGKDNRQRG